MQNREMYTVKEKHQIIVEKIRKEIVGGKYTAKSRLPTSRELATRFRASSVTVNRALACLIRDGYIRTRGRLGTFVAANPPHLCRFGLVCTTCDRHRSPFVEAVLEAASEFEGRAVKRIVSYVSTDMEDLLSTYLQLHDDVKADRLAGLIFVSSPEPFVGSGMWEMGQLPKVVIGQGRITRPDGIPVVSHDYRNFIEQAMQAFFEGGKRNIAALFTPETFATCSADFAGLITEFAMKTDPRWVHTVHPECLESVDSILKLIKALPADESPDGILIFDDALTEETVRALTSNGIDVPGRLQVVSFDSFPGTDDRSSVEVVRLGFDHRELLTESFTIVRKWRDGALASQVPQGEITSEENVSSN